MESKYYDWCRHRGLTVHDGCKLAEWSALAGSHPFAVHPRGFWVFLSPDAIAKSDEYAAADPYGVEENLNNGFHRRRAECNRELLGLALRDTSPTPRVLDLGCGQGHLTERLRSAWPQAEFSGLDYSVSAIDYAAEHFPDIDFVVADAQWLPYAEDYFDIVVCNNIWEHVPAPLVVLAGIRKILKPNGKLIISTPSRYQFHNLVRVSLGKQVEMNSPLHVTEYSVGQVTEMLRFGGFRVEKAFSKPLPREIRSLSGLLAFRVALPIVRAYLRIVGSHHSLESTVFYLACMDEKQKCRAAETPAKRRSTG
jgi:SAM-dependent methyltransferase